MSTTMHTTPEVLAAVEPTLLPGGPILVATDTSPDSDAAFPLAFNLASRAHADVTVLSVLQPVNTPTYGVDGLVISMEPAVDSENAREAATRAQLMRMVSSTAAWPVTVKTGDPAREIATASGAMNSQLVVVGRGRHSGFDRMFGVMLVGSMMLFALGVSLRYRTVGGYAATSV